MLIKKILLGSILAGLTVLGFAVAANAAEPGPYLGLQAGWAQSNYNNNLQKESNIAGRVLGGYQFNQYFAAELGYSRFRVTHNISNQYAVDVAGKGIIPLDNDVNIYGKLGAAYVNAGLNSNAPAVGNISKVLPEAGVGLSYDINPNVPVDISYTRIQKVGTTNLSNINFVALGVAYNFGT